MKKQIVIKDKKIIKEDALDRVSKNLKIRDSLYAVRDIILGVKNIAWGAVVDSKNVLWFMKNIAKTLTLKIIGRNKASVLETLKQEFEKASKDRDKLTSEWLKIKSDLGIDKPLDEFLDAMYPGSGVAIEWLEKNSSPEFFIKNPDKPDRGWGDSGGGDHWMKYNKWYKSLSDRDRNKLSSWAAANQKEFNFQLNQISKGNSLQVINTLTRKAINENKSFLIKNKQIIFEKVNNSKKIHDDLLKKAYSRSIAFNALNSLVKKETEYSEYLEDLTSKFKKIDGVKEAIKKEIEKQENKLKQSQEN